MRPPQLVGGPSVENPSAAEPDASQSEVSSTSGEYSSRDADRDYALFLKLAWASRPVLLLSGDGGEEAAQELLTQISGVGSCRVHVMQGHAWWATGGSQASSLVEAQRRFNIDKLEAVLSEALMPGNSSRLHVAFLREVSASEWIHFLVPLGFQWQNGRLMRIDNIHFPRPRPFPRNLRIIATLKGQIPPIPRDHSLRGISIVHWRSGGRDEAMSCGRTGSPDTSFGKISIPPFHSTPLSLTASVGRIWRWRSDLTPSLRALFHVLQQLDRLPGPLVQALRENAITDLANSFDDRGVGLFDADLGRNSLVAMDLHLSLSLLPIARSLRQFETTDQLTLPHEMLVEFPRSRSYLKGGNQGYAS